MMLPSHLQNFPKPTLILIGNFGKTVFHLAEEIEITEIKTVTMPEPTHPDSESSVVVGAGRHSKTDTGEDDAEDRKKYTKELAETLTDLADGHGIKDIQLVMPAELINRLKEKLSKDVVELITRELDKDLAKTNLVETLERLHNIPVPVKE